MTSASAQVEKDTSFNPIPCAAASAAMFLSCMDTLITNVALPTVTAELGGGIVGQQWVVDGYTLPFAALLLLAGNLSDRMGARRAFAAGTAGFAASSLVCALASSIEVLILGRALLGVAAALILPSSMALIREAYPRERDRTRALALWGIGGSASAAVGPLLGGLLVPIHWSLVFSINIPVCLLVLWLCRRLAPSPRQVQPLDPLGQVLGVLGLGCLVGGIIEAGAEGVTSPLPAALLAAGIVGCAAFLAWQARCEHPMMPLGLFRAPGMRLAALGGFVMILNWNGFVFLATLFLQQELGLSPLESGLAFVPAAFVSMAGNVMSDRISATRGARTCILAGIAAMVAGYGLMFLRAGSLDGTTVAIAVCLTGAGGALTTPCLANLVLKSAGLEQAGIASAVFNTLRQVGGAVGIALFGALTTALATFSLGLAASLAISLVLVAVLLACTLRLAPKPR